MEKIGLDSTGKQEVREKNRKPVDKTLPAQQGMADAWIRLVEGRDAEPRTLGDAKRDELTDSQHFGSRGDTICG